MVQATCQKYKYKAFFGYKDNFYGENANFQISEIGSLTHAFDKTYFLKKGLIYSIKDSFYLLKRSLDVWNGLFTSGRETFVVSVQTHLRQVYDSSVSNIVMGMLLGRVDTIPAHLYHLFEITGTQHLLAISGFNVSFFVLLATRLYGKIVSKSTLILLNVSVILVFAWIVSFSPGLFRAFSMFFISSIAWYLNRQKNALHSFVATLIMALILDVQILFSIGFQLSCAATAGIILISTVSRDSKQYLDYAVAHFPLVFVTFKNYFFDSIIISLVAQIAVLPLLLYHFGSFSLVGILATVVVAWIIPLILLFGVIMLFLQFVIPFQFQVIVGLPLLFLVKGFLFLLQLLNFKQFLVVMPKIGIGTTVCLYFLIFIAYGLFVVCKKIKRRQNHDKIYHFCL